MKLVDSCGWLAHYQDSPLADAFAPHLKGKDVQVPTIVLYEVYKVLLSKATQEIAEQAAAEMKTRTVVSLTDDIALLAAELSVKHKLAMADAIVYATSQVVEAQVVTSDRDLGQLEGVEYLQCPPDEGHS